ncbi:MAG: AmmeMemoRadiSam system protein B [Chloroflexi bacterium]|nr:MAG: AmmeMemoRadiSam system protein B [Chloroflexota bacterium]
MRRSAVAGTWYAGTAVALRRQIEDCFMHGLGPGLLPGGPRSTKRRVLGLVSPHAGYMFSGPVASHGYLKLASEPRPHTVVIVGPNHSGLGADVAVSREDRWQTPLGDVEVDAAAAGAVVSGSHWAEWDDLAHAREHSAELQLPFLQYIYGEGFQVVVIAMLVQNLEVSQDVGKAIAASLKGKDGLVVASSDFSHYEVRSVARRKDNLAIEAILSLEPRRLAEAVVKHDISMCGPGPVMAMLTACKELGATSAELLRYATSGDITGDAQVVGYASVVVSA